MFFYFDEKDNYRFKVNQEYLQHIPELRDIATSKKYGWNFVYYVFLFLSREPFGKKPPADRDARISEIIDKYPFDIDGRRNVTGFYLTKEFEAIEKQWAGTFPDTTYNTYLTLTQKINEINHLTAKLDMSNMEDMALFGEYLNQQEKSLKVLKSIEDRLTAEFSSTGQKMGISSLRKEIEKENR